MARQTENLTHYHIRPKFGKIQYVCTEDHTSALRLLSKQTFLMYLKRLACMRERSLKILSVVSMV